MTRRPAYSGGIAREVDGSHTALQLFQCRSVRGTVGGGVRPDQRGRVGRDRKCGLHQGVNPSWRRWIRGRWDPRPLRPWRKSRICLVQGRAAVVRPVRVHSPEHLPRRVSTTAFPTVVVTALPIASPTTRPVMKAEMSLVVWWLAVEERCSAVELDWGSHLLQAEPGWTSIRSMSWTRETWSYRSRRMGWKSEYGPKR